MTTSPRTAGHHQYELTNHLGNVSVIVSDNKLLSANQSQKLYLPDVLEYQDYYPFGMVMNDRKGSYNAQDYRYGYNGKENDNEVKGESNQQDYGFRVYDPRVGRFLSVDPLTESYPFYSPYQFAGNKPIIAIDLDGCEELIMTRWLWKDSGKRVQLSNEITLINQNWPGVKYREGYFFRGKYYHENSDERNGVARMRMENDNPEYFKALNLYYQDEQRKVNRKASNAILFTSGIITTMGSRGKFKGASETGKLSKGLWGLFEFSSGIMASTSAVAKEYFDNKGNFVHSDQITSSPLGVLGLALDKGFKENFYQTAGEFLNGLLTLYSSWNDFSTLGKVDKSLTIYGFLNAAYTEAGLNVDDKKIKQYADKLNNIMIEYNNIQEENKK